MIIGRVFNSAIEFLMAGHGMQLRSNRVYAKMPKEESTTSKRKSKKEISTGEYAEQNQAMASRRKRKSTKIPKEELSDEETKEFEKPVVKWSQPVTQFSIALDLDEGVFTWKDPKKIAESLKHSAEVSERRKAGPFQSAMSMLNFYINRAGKKLPEERKMVLNQAKDELRVLFDRPRKGTGGIKKVE